MNTDRVQVAAPAKINLFLKITGRRQDGYHELATLMQKVDLYDQLQLVRKKLGISLRCIDSDLPTDRQNLAYQAAEKFLTKFGHRLSGEDRGVAIVLEKKIPVAAGLGGGSSDAAAVLRGMEQLFFSADCPQEELFNIAGRLGADVPFSLSRYPAAWATGIGDQLEAAVSLADYILVLVNPGISVSTRWAYETFALTATKKEFNLTDFDINDSPFIRRNIRPAELVNDLESVTAGHFKEITEIKSRLLAEGAVAAMMSGSGPTVVGLFRKAEGREHLVATCCEKLRNVYSEVFMVNPL